MGAIDDVLAATKRLGEVRQMTNDPAQIALAQKALTDAKARAAQETKAKQQGSDSSQFAFSQPMRR